jgi:hypothetical protein
VDKGVARALLVTLLSAETLNSFSRDNNRRRLFAQAQERARALGRPLVVIGAPKGGAWSSVMGPAYGCGDITVDIDPSGAKGCPKVIAADIGAGPVPGIPDNSAVVYVSCVLEYVQNGQKALCELLRMAGSPSNLFIVPIEGWSMSSVFYPGLHWAIQPNQATGAVNARPVTTLDRVVYAGVLAWLGYEAFFGDGP